MPTMNSVNLKFKNESKISGYRTRQWSNKTLKAKILVLHNGWSYIICIITLVGINDLGTYINNLCYRIKCPRILLVLSQIVAVCTISTFRKTIILPQITVSRTSLSWTCYLKLNLRRTLNREVQCGCC